MGRFRRVIRPVASAAADGAAAQEEVKGGNGEDDGKEEPEGLHKLEGNWGAPPGVGTVMSIDKESDGVPEIDPRRRTTKVNLFIIVAVAAFLGVGALLMTWLSRR